MAVRDGRSYQLSALPVIVIAQLLGVAAVVLMCVWTFKFRKGLSLASHNNSLLFNAHPFFMFLGLIYFAGQGIIVFKMILARRNVRKFIHMALHLVAIILSALGLYAIFKWHRNLGLADVYSLHSWLGMITICLYALQWLFGFVTFLFPGAEMRTRASFLPWHAFFGVIIFLMAICTAETGLLQKFISLKLFRQPEAYVVNFLGLAILFFGISVVLIVILPRAY